MEQYRSTVFIPQKSLLLPSPARSQGFTILGEIFVYVTVFVFFFVCFFYPSNEAVTFRLHGWCMLGVFLLLAFTHLGHECTGSFESVRWNVCVHRLDLGIYSQPKEFGGKGVRTHVNSKGKIPCNGKILPREGSNPPCCITQDNEPNTLPMS